MNRYAILTQHPTFNDGETPEWGYDEEIIADSRGQARRYFTKENGIDFTTPLWIRKMHLVKCWGCDNEWYGYKSFPCDEQHQEEHANWCGECNLPWIETGHQDRELSNCRRNKS